MSDIKTEQHLDASMSARALFVMLIKIGVNLSTRTCNPEHNYLTNNASPSLPKLVIFKPLMSVGSFCILIHEMQLDVCFLM